MDLGSLFQIASPLIQAGTALFGASQASSANRDAADTAAAGQLAATEAQIAANKEARGEFRAAADRGIAAIRSGTQGYADTIAPLTQARPVGLTTYRGLTSAQQIARDDLRRNGMATLAASGLRGSAAGIRAVQDSDRRFVASAADAHDQDMRGELRRAQGNADSAVRGLASVRAQEGGAIANTEIGQGNQIAQSLAADGSAQANGLTQAANTQAQATTANGSLWGEAIGGIGSVIADSMKSANTEKYRTTQGSI
ncbi:hypothetical protein [Falsiroseomonas tokyonensis]|uniref:Uncharacterized protein n=1 Tax=Falsiroseomonas tokyonensis TaxID=430521 RepID=A0ABV7BZT6_9PROT|nr:hypothetical protein [Falsiroseomonas tokyonensis]MBU8540175.1 hypothetical protein [Falsiroseomonas tokyonensis]